MTDNTLKYKDFYGSAEYPADDECFFGKILGKTNIVTFEGDSVVSLKDSFTEAVEDYVTLCGEADKKQRPFPQYFYGERIWFVLKTPLQRSFHPKIIQKTRQARSCLTSTLLKPYLNLTC
jgi:hypothetical protein